MDFIAILAIMDLPLPTKIQSVYEGTTINFFFMDMQTYQDIYVKDNYEFIGDFYCGVKIHKDIEWFGKFKSSIF